MKNTAIITILVLLSFGSSQSMKPSERLLSQLPQEVQALFNQLPAQTRPSLTPLRPKDKSRPMAPLVLMALSLAV